MRSRTSIQFVMLLGEAGLFLFSGAALYVIISRWGGADFLGQYSLVLAWILLFQAFGFFGIPDYLMRELGREGERSDQSIGHALIIGLIASIIAMLVMTAAVLLFSYDPAINTALLLGTLTLPVATISAICRGIFLAKKKSEAILLVAVVESATVISINGYLVLHGYGIVPIVMTVVAAKAVSCLFSLSLLWIQRIQVSWRVEARFCRTFIPPLFTFALSNSLGLLGTRITVIMLSIWSSFSVLGMFSAGSKVMELALVIPSIFAQMMMPPLAGMYAGQRAYERHVCETLFSNLLAMTIPLSVGLLLFAPSILQLLFGAEFLDAVLILRILTVYLVIESLDTMMAVLLKAANRQNQDVRLYLANPVSNVILNILLIPTLGGLGAALAKLVSGATSLVLRYRYISKNLVSMNLVRVMATSFAVTLGAAAVVLVLKNQLNPLMLGAVYGALCIIALSMLHYFTVERAPVAVYSSDASRRT
jgi:O-antigen/teichoic acid export membrane protein